MWNSPLRSQLPALAIAALTALAILGSWRSEPLPSLQRADLDLRNGILHARGVEKPFNGTLVESFPGGSRKLAIDIRAGQAHGLSRGWFESGQPEVEEHFSRGFSHGVRTRWHENGHVRSLAPITLGKLDGRYEEWHASGHKALEILFVNGQPEGEARAWSEDGAARPPRFYRNGVATSR